ncbi:hypothetical protein Emag_006037 [Eimeria magna]
MSQVPPPPSERQRLQKQLLQHLRRDLNRLCDGSRGTRLRGAQAILDVFKTEAARRAASSGADVTASSSVPAARDCSGRCQPAYSEVFLKSVYVPISALCGDANSETCRAVALELLELVVNEFLSREEVIFLCSGDRRSCNTSALRGLGCSLPCVSAPEAFEKVGGDCACKSGFSGTTASAPMKPLVAVLANRLRANPAAEETSEELRLLVLHLLQQLVQQYAASPHCVSKDEADQEEKQLPHGWDTKALADSLLEGVAGALRDGSPSNAVEACRLLSIVSAKLEPSLMLQSSKNLLDRLAACLTRPQRAVRLEAIEAYEALLIAVSCPAATASTSAAVSAANLIATAAKALRHLVQQESAVQNKLRVAQLVRRLLQEMSPRTLLRPKVQPELLLLLFLLLGDADPKVGVAAKQTLLSVAPRSVMYYRKRHARIDLRKEQRKQVEREAEGGSSTSSDASSSGEEALELYGFCSAAGGGSVEPQQQQQFHQGTPLLLLVQHAVLRELRGDGRPAGSASSEPWNCEGLQELGACSALCCSLQALEVSVHCAGLIAKLLPPCAWLPHVAAHLGLQREAVLYTSSKEAALAAAIGKATDSGTDAEAASATSAVQRFLKQFPAGYKSVVEIMGLSETATQKPQKQAEHLVCKVFGGKKGHVCSVEAKQHALLLLARMLRSLKLPVKQLEQPLGGNDQGRDVAAGFRGEYELEEEEIFLLVRIIEQVQAGGDTNCKTSAPAASATAAAAVAENNGELLPYVAAPLLQLLLAGGSLCKLEAKRLFAAALMQGVDCRSHREIATATVRQVCGCTGTSSLFLYLSFIGDFVESELGSVFKNEDGQGLLQAATDSARAATAAEQDCFEEAVWSSKDTRRLLLLHALHGAGEAAEGRQERLDTIKCPWLPGLFKVSLLCVSQVIPALSNDKPLDCHSPSAQVNGFGQAFEDASASQEVPISSSESKDADHLSTQEAPADTKSERGDAAASIALLSPLLVCCIDDDWNVDVRGLAVGVVRQLFLDLRDSLWQREALKQLATATAGPLLQRLDDARDDIRVAAASALEALLLQRPPLLHGGFVTDVFKRLCLCLDDRNQVLASAAAAALLAGADVHQAVLLEEVRGAEYRCLFPERYKQLLEKAQMVRRSSNAESNDAAPQRHESEAAKVEDEASWCPLGLDLSCPSLCTVTLQHTQTVAFLAQAIKAEDHSSEPQQSKTVLSSATCETIDISQDVKLPEPQAGDLFEWEHLACDPPYHLQGDVSFETAEKHAERQALKAHPEVQAALEHVWSLFSKNDKNRVTKTEYSKVLLRICLVLVPELRGRDVVNLIEEEWLQDSKGEEALSFNAFYNSFFELADIWTPAIDGAAYADFLRRLFRRITIKKAHAELKLRPAKIKPKIVVKVLNQSIKCAAAVTHARLLSDFKKLHSGFELQKPEVQEDDKKDAQRVDLMIDSNGAASCVAEWSKAEHKAVEAMLVAHISGESKELDQLELEEEVLHDCTAVSPEEPLSTEWAEFTDIAPLGAASRAFLQSVFSRAIAKTLQSQQQQTQEHADVEPEVVAEEIDLPSVSPEVEGQANEESPRRAVEPGRPSPPQPPARRHFAEYQSKSDLPVQVEAVSEEDLRPFNSVGVPVQLEGVRKLVRLKAVPASHHEDAQMQPSSNEAQKVQSPPETQHDEEESIKVYHVDESQAALLRDLNKLKTEEPPLEETKEHLSPREGNSPLAEKVDPKSVLETPRHPLPQAEVESDHGPATEPESNLEREAESRPRGPKPEPEQLKPELELESEGEALKEESRVLEKAPTPQPEDALEPKSPSPKTIEEAPSAALKSEQPQRASRFALHRPKHFQTRVFHSLREESLKQIRGMSFRKSIIITGVGTVAVRRRSDYKIPFARQNLPQSQEPKPQPVGGSASETAAGPLDFEMEGDPLVEGWAEGDPWQKAYAEPEKPLQEHAIVVTEEDEVAFAQQPRQAILILGPNGSEKSRVAYKLATNMGLEWLQAEYLLSALCKISRHLLTPLGRRLTRMMRRGYEVPVLEGLLLTLEFMASKRSRSAGYVLELPNGDKQDIKAFLRHLRDLSGRRTLNWPELLLRHARMCDQRLERRREEKRRKRLLGAMKHWGQVDLPASRNLRSEVEQSNSKDEDSSGVRQLVGEAVEGVIAVSGVGFVSDSHEISALADLATRLPRAPVKDDSVKDAAGPKPCAFLRWLPLDPLGDGNDVITKAALEIQDREERQPFVPSNTPSMDAPKPAHGDIASKGAATDIRKELQKDASPTSLYQSEKEAGDKVQDKTEIFDHLAASKVEVDAKDSQKKRKKPDESAETSADRTLQTASALPATNEIASDPQQNTKADFEAFSSYFSDSDSEADVVYQKAARDSSQPQANPLMDAFPGRAVILQIEPQDRARAVMLDTSNGDLINEIRNDEKTEKEDEESEEIGCLELSAKTDLLEPPHVAAFWLNKQNLWGHGGDDAAAVEDKGALEAQVVLAGSQAEAALEFLSARPPGEVAVPVPGAEEAEKLYDLLQRIELVQDSEACEGEAEEEPISKDNVGKSDAGSGLAEGPTLRGGNQLGNTDRETLLFDAEGSPRTTVPPNKYSMADDLWGESQLDVQGSETPNTDKKRGNNVDDLFQLPALSLEDSTGSHVESSCSYSSDELQRLFERKWTAWGPFCPVTLKEGKVEKGKKEFAVDFAGKIFLLADEEKRGRFIQDPKRYVDTPPCIPPTTSVYIFGPSYAGISKQARLLSRAYGFVAVDVLKELAEGHSRVEEEKQRFLKEDERRRVERMLQERLRRERLHEEKERGLMAAEDDERRLVLMSSSASDEPPLHEVETKEMIQLDESLKVSPAALLPDVPVSAEVEGLQVVAPETAETQTVEDARAAPDEERFILLQEEETLLQDGQTLGR